MAISANDIQFFLSTTSAAAGYTLPGVPGNSLGKFMATNVVNPAVPLDDLFTDITSVQNAANQVDYQCLFVVNFTNTGLTARTPYIWFPQPLWTFGGAALSLAVDPTGRVLYNSGTAQALTINNSLQTPQGISTWSPGPHALFTNGVLLPSLPPLYCVAVWIQRSALGTPPLTPQTLGLSVTFQTDA